MGLRRHHFSISFIQPGPTQPLLQPLRWSPGPDQALLRLDSTSGGGNPVKRRNRSSLQLLRWRYFCFYIHDELSCKLSSSISIDRTQIRYEWLQAGSAILPKAIIRQQCRLRKEKTSIGSIEEGWWWSITSCSIATKTESCTIVNPIQHLSMICSFERHKYCTDDF